MLRYFTYGWRDFTTYPDLDTKRLNWEFYAVLEGSCAPDVKLDGSLPHLHSSMLWLMPPRMPYVWKGNEQPCLRISLHFATLPQLMVHSLPARGYYQTPISEKQGQRILELTKEIEPIYYHPDPTYELRISTLVNELCLITLHQTQFKKDNPLYYLAANKVREAESWYLENLHLSPSVESVAAAINLSASQLRRHFQVIRKQAPKQVFRTLRLRRSCMLLAATDYTISDIAERSGFVSSQDFHRAFKEHFAATPRQWRTKTKDTSSLRLDEQNESSD